jgi:threonine/homoserine/homoserine lactone efflux protein
MTPLFRLQSKNSFNISGLIVLTELIIFLTGAVVVSLSGVMAPGPMSAATIASGARNRHAGALIAIGHAIVEFPLMLLIMGGAKKLFELSTVRMVIGLAGGLVLIAMAIQIIRGDAKPDSPKKSHTYKRPILTGIILSGGNPYFLVWWATIGLALATRARQLGILAFGLFAIVHWLCDLIWLEALSWASFKGSVLLGKRAQRYILLICAIALLFIAAVFLYDAGGSLVKLIIGRNSGL